VAGKASARQTGAIEMSESQKKLSVSEPLVIFLLVSQVLLSLVLIWRVIVLERRLFADASGASLSGGLSFDALPLAPGVSDDDDPAQGPADAPVTIIGFSDYECSGCRQSHKAMQQVLAANPDKIRFVARDFPLFTHPNAFQAAEAAGCAHKQGQFWAMHDAIFADAGPLSLERLQALADQVGLDRAEFDRCMAGHEAKSEIEADVADGNNYGIDVTPTYFINGRRLRGGMPAELWQPLIDQAVKQAAAGP